MKRIAARLLVVVGLALVSMGRKLDPKPAPAARIVTLNRRQYRTGGRQPSRGECYRLGLTILFKSVAFATLGV